MTAVDDDTTLESGEWGVVVAAVVSDVRRDLGEAAADRVATVLHDFKSDLIGLGRQELATAERLLENTIDEVAEARRAHERLQADVARMNATVREAKAEAARLRADAEARAIQREADSQARALSESARIGAAWAEVRQHELEVADRRAQLLDLDARVVAAPPDPRMAAIDLREEVLNARQKELDEWEAEIVEHARALDDRAGSAPSPAAPGRRTSGWGRRVRPDA